MLDYLDDIASDMSAFHGIQDVNGMSAKSFFVMAERLVAYKGVMQARLRMEMEDAENDDNLDDEDNYQRAEAIASKFRQQKSNIPGPLQNGFMASLRDPEALKKAREIATINRQQ